MISLNDPLPSVAPSVGAWIETSPLTKRPQPRKSLPPWERGLKQSTTKAITNRTTSLPPWERGLKRIFSMWHQSPSSVAPSVGAWIETYGECCQLYNNLSLPPWERGLKHRWLPCNREGVRVAPSVGAWIETILGVPQPIGSWSLPLWERGLKRVPHRPPDTNF